MRKEEIVCNKRFLFFSQCFLPYMALFFHFKCSLKCRLQFVSIWTSLKLCRLVIDYGGNTMMMYVSIIRLTHYQTTNFRLFQTERVCRRQFQILRNWKKVIQTGRKHCGKRRNCPLRAISPFPTVFSKSLFPRGIKRCHCAGMG